MAWTESTRPRCERPFGRCASNLANPEWELIEPFLPPSKPTGQPRRTAMREILNAILYIASTCCVWRMLLNDFPPVTPIRRAPQSVGQLGCHLVFPVLFGGVARFVR